MNRRNYWNNWFGYLSLVENNEKKYDELCLLISNI